MVARKRYLHFLVFVSLVVLFISSIMAFDPSSCVANAQTQTTFRKTKEIFVNGGLTSGFFLGVNSSGNRTDWITLVNDSIRMAYPVGQSWGAVFITYGPVANRNSINLSEYQNVSLTVKGELGGESVQVGIKNANDSDLGTETKLDIKDLPAQWKTYEYNLSQFTSADVTKLYVVLEFVFSGSKAQTVYFNNITYLSDPIPIITPSPTPTPPTPTPAVTISPTPTLTNSPPQTLSPTASPIVTPTIPESTTALTLSMIVATVLIAIVALRKRRVDSK